MKDIYDLLNDVQTDTQSYGIEPVSELDKKRMKKVLRQHTGKRSHKKAAGVACAAVLLAVLAVPVVGGDMVYAAGEGIAWHISSFLGLERDLQEYATVVGTSQTDNGYTLRLNEVVLDQGSLVVSTSTYKEDGTVFTEDEFINMGAPAGEIFINGRPIFGGSGGGAGLEEDGSIGAVISYDLDNIDTSDELDIKLVYRDIGPIGDRGLFHSATSGKWEFHFTADGAALAADTITIALNQQFTLPNDIKVTLMDYTSNAMGQRVYFTTVGGTATDRSDYHLRLQGVDDQGQEIVFETRRADGRKGTGYMCCEILGAQITEQTKWLDLTPYAVAFPKGSGKMSHDYQPMGEPFRIELAQ